MINFYQIKKLFPAFNPKTSRQGIAIYLAVVTLSIVLAIALGVRLLSVYQLKNLNEAGNSVVAFAAAETGIEWALSQYYSSFIDDTNYQVRCNITPNICVKKIAIGQAFYTVAETMAADDQSCPTGFLCVKSVGDYNGTQRVIKVLLKANP